MNNNQEIKDKALMWYFHPNEIIRLMRVYLYENIDPKLDLTPLYKDNLNIGILLEVNNNISFLDLSLYYLINVNKITNILVYSNNLSNNERIKNLCKSYQSINKNLNLVFYTTKKELWNKEQIGSISELNGYYIGLAWAKEQKFDILIKLYSYEIPCYKWVNDFKKLVLNTDGITFCLTNNDKNNYNPIQLKYFGMNVNSWSNEFILDKMKWLIDNEITIYSSFWFDNLAKQLDYQNYSKKYNEYKLKNKIGFIYSGHVNWNLNIKNEKNNKDYLLNEIQQKFGKNKYILM